MGYGFLFENGRGDGRGVDADDDLQYLQELRLPGYTAD